MKDTRMVDMHALKYAELQNDNALNGTQRAKPSSSGQIKPANREAEYYGQFDAVMFKRKYGSSISIIPRILYANLSPCRKPTNRVKMSVPLAVKIITRFARGKRCNVNTVSKALEHLQNGSVSSAYAQKVVPYLIKLFKHPVFFRIQRQAMKTFLWLACFNKPGLGSALTNRGAKAMRARLKDSDRSVRSKAAYYYAALLGVANLSAAEVKAAGPDLRDRIEKDPESEVRRNAVYAYQKLYNSRWVKKTSTKEATAGVRCLRKAGVKYKKLYVPLAYNKAAIKLDRKAANYEARALYKLRKSRDIATRYLGVDLFKIIAWQHASKISMVTLKKWEKLLWSVINSPLPKPSGRLIPLRESLARRTLRSTAIMAYSYVISRYKHTRLDKEALKVVKFIGDYDEAVRINVVVVLWDLFTKFGSTAKQRIAKAIRSRFTDTDPFVRRLSVKFYGDLICKHVNRAELLAAKGDLQRPLTDKNPVVRRLARKALAAINQRLQP